MQSISRFARDQNMAEAGDVITAWYFEAPLSELLGFPDIINLSLALHSFSILWL